jgi:hypothetical protein
MRLFDHFNTATKDPCPICKTKDDKKTVLIIIDGTEQDGIAEAKQTHLDCIELRYKPEPGIIYQRIVEKGK